MSEHDMTQRRLCAHADDGQPMHWLEPGERCDRTGNTDEDRPDQETYDDAVKRVAASRPPLRAEQRDRLATLFQPANPNE